MHMILKDKRGLTLLELLVALAISAVLIAALYRTFVGQHKTYTVQEQVVEMRQNVRGAISNMVRELRMAGFGGVATLLPITIGGNIYQNVINRDRPGTGWITVVTTLISSDSQVAKIKTTPTQTGNSPVIEVSNVADFDADPAKGKNYISIGGVEAHRITLISNNRLTLGEKLTYKFKDYDPLITDHSDPKFNPNPTRVYPVRAISYRAGVRNENTGGGAQPTAENIESVQFDYLDAEGNPAVSDTAVQMIRVRITAKTDIADPQYKSGDGYRRREISSNIQLRNVIISP